MTFLKNLWQRLDGPTKIGLFFATLGVTLTVMGVFRDPTVPINVWSLVVGSLIGGGTWGLISWVVAFATVEVERDVREAELAEKAND